MIRLEPGFSMAGVEVGHWADEVAMTGCTVVLLPESAVCSGEVRGGAPASRELELLHLGRTVSSVDAVVLTGGSAFGLVVADGVMEVLAQRGRGLETRSGRVPIVVAMALYDLGTGDPSVRPNIESGRIAATTASNRRVLPGPHGAGTGCTAAKWAAEKHRRPAGLGVATVSDGSVSVGAVLAVNAVGDLPENAWPKLAVEGIRPIDADQDDPHGQQSAAREGTTIGVVTTDASLDKTGCHLVAQSAHDGMARALVPAHTGGDGDAVVVASVGAVEHPLEQVRLLASLAVEAAVRTGLGDTDPAATVAFGSAG